MTEKSWQLAGQRQLKTVYALSLAIDPRKIAAPAAGATNMVNGICPFFDLFAQFVISESYR